MHACCVDVWLTALHNERMPTIQELTEFLPLEHRDGATVKCVIDQVEGMSLMTGMEYGSSRPHAHCCYVWSVLALP